MKIIIGLGNPEEEMKNCRHNIGHIAIDALHEKFRCGNWNSNMDCKISEGTIENQKVLLVKPQVFINESGVPVKKILKEFNAKTHDTIILHNDIEIEPGRIKAKIGGSSGHNGMKSIQSLNGNDYARIRIGVGQPENKAELIPWVLSDVPDQDLKKIKKAMEEMIKFLPFLMNGQLGIFQSRVNKDIKNEPKDGNARKRFSWSLLDRPKRYF